jgi:uncharacterized protein (DUF1810 family)
MRSSGTDDDPHDLARFLEAQGQDYDRAISELRRGRKQSHWMWYVFPQFQGLGISSTSQYYAIRSSAEAEAYLLHPVLGPRLIECCDALLGICGRSAREILGPDDVKLRSCATLFAEVSPEGSVFHRILDKYFDGAKDAATLRVAHRSGAMTRSEGRRRD